jgi:hypothetical protein
MGKTNFTFVRPFWMASLFALATFLTPAFLNAQCQDNVTVTLTTQDTVAGNSECIYVLAPSNVRAGDVKFNGVDIPTLNQSVIVNDGNPNRQQIGNIRRDTIDRKGTFDYGLLDNKGTDDTSDDELICWGTVTAEDKTAPTIECPDDTEVECFLIDDVLNNGNSVRPDRGGVRGYVYTGIPTVMEDCYLESGFEWSDQIEYYTCENGSNGDDENSALLSRRFTIEDESGLTASCVQVIRFKRVFDDNFSFQQEGTLAFERVYGTAFRSNDLDFKYDGDLGKWFYTHNTCSPDPDNAPATIYPIYGPADDGNYYSIDEVGCDLSTTVEKSQFLDVCTDGSYKEERRIKVFDWCAGMSSTSTFDYQVKVGDFAAPRLPSSGDCSSIQRVDDADPELFLDWLNDEGDPRWFNFCGMISTGPMNCTAAINTSYASLNAQLDFVLVDCNAFTLSVEVYSKIPETIGKIPTGDTIWVKGDYSRNGDMFMGLPEGDHVLFVSASDGCYNSDHFYIPFVVMDLVKPVMKCDDELRVTLVEGDAKLGIGGYGLVTTGDVDEGSWDNCELVDLKVRREISGDAAADYQKKYEGTAEGLEYPALPGNGNPDLTLPGYEDTATKKFETGYTPWRDIAEFFCADLEEKVTVELWGRDRKGNTSICWLDVEVENGTNVGLELTGRDKRISCDDYAAYLVDGGEFDPYDFAGIRTTGVYDPLNDGFIGCSSPVGELTYDLDIDQCGFGTIKIYIDQTSITADESKNYIDTDEDAYITITVAELHDYWIKFPADTKVTCDIPDEAGVAVNEGSCDLLTVYENDEIFESTQDPDACYKIFRTYKVINWCEYDGESQPTVVSRDWDAHNAVDCYKDREPGAYQGAYTNDYYKDAGEYNLNPQEPDGDGQPGDEDIYVIVEINNVDGLYPTSANSQDDFSDELFDVVYYDNNSNPYDNSTANLWGDNDVNFTSSNPWGGLYVRGDRGRIDEGYWFAVVRGEYSCDSTSTSVWYDDDNDPTNPDIDGNDFNDDTDNRYGSYGYWQYTQHIIVYDDSKPEAVVTVGDTCVLDGVDCDKAIDFSIAISDTCSTVGITATAVVMPGAIAVPLTANADNTEFTGTTSEELTLGKYTLVVTVNDGCGNITVEEQEFEVIDCKGPAPICHEGLIVELMPTEDGGGMAEVWATDYKASDIYDCTALSNDANGYGIVQDTAYSIYFLDSLDTDASGTIEASEFPTGSQSGIVLTCADQPMQPVAIFARDAAGNRDFCLTFVEVQDNNNACGTPAASGEIAGAVATETSANVEGVEVQLSGARSMMYMTNAAGSFSFDGLAQGGDYTVTPQKDQNHLNGVSTFDLVLISKHILGVSQLDSPYKLIAADVNNSQSVTTLDLIQLRKLILNIDTEFANNTSWRFIDRAHNFASPSNPWSATIPEFKNINNLGENAEAQFVAVKIGDVNGSANVEARSATGTFAINTAEQSMVAGNEYTINFSADMANIAGYQFTLNVANAEIVDVIYGAAKAENFGVFTKEGVITTSFNGEAAGTLFSVVVRATADVNVSEAISINSRYTNAEAYTNDASNLNVALNVAGATAAEAAFALNQNTPNPFQGETVIGFNLPEAQEATIAVQDVAGRTIKVIEGDFVSGYNQVTLNSNDLPSAGVYFYTLTAGDKSATKKLILVDALNR